MSRTRRRVPPFMKGCSPEFKIRVERGLAPIDMSNDEGIVVWTQRGKQAMKKFKTRASRRMLKKMGIEYVNLRMPKAPDPEDMLGLPQVSSSLE